MPSTLSVRLRQVAVGWALGFVILGSGAAAPAEDSTPTTESICNFGMVKGQSRACQVPIPANCVVANFPGTTKPWTNISKGGGTACGFNENVTDWKTRITGSCGRCTTGQCSARFSVMFDCSQKK